MACNGGCEGSCPEQHIAHISTFLAEHGFNVLNPTETACAAIRGKLEQFLKEEGITNCPVCLSRVLQKIFGDENPFPKI